MVYREKDFDWMANQTYCGYCLVKKCGKYNYLSGEDNKTFLLDEWVDDIMPFNGEFMSYIRKGNKWNVINPNGIFLLNDWYSEIRYNKRDKLFSVSKENKWNVINPKGVFIFDEWVDDIDFFDNYYFTRFRKNDKYNFLDSNGNILFQEWFDWIGEFDNNKIAKVIRNGKINFIYGKNGKLLFRENSYKLNYFFNNNLIKNIGKFNIFKMQLKIIFN